MCSYWSTEAIAARPECTFLVRFTCRPVKSKLKFGQLFLAENHQDDLSSKTQKLQKSIAIPLIICEILSAVGQNSLFLFPPLLFLPSPQRRSDGEGGLMQMQENSLSILPRIFELSFPLDFFGPIFLSLDLPLRLDYSGKDVLGRVFLDIRKSPTKKHSCYFWTSKWVAHHSVWKTL